MVGFSDIAETLRGGTGNVWRTVELIVRHMGKGTIMTFNAYVESLNLRPRFGAFELVRG